jgi:hypothetical protein
MQRSVTGGHFAATWPPVIKMKLHCGGYGAEFVLVSFCAMCCLKATRGAAVDVCRDLVSVAAACDI